MSERDKQVGREGVLDGLRRTALMGCDVKELSVAASLDAVFKDDQKARKSKSLVSEWYHVVASLCGLCG